MTPSVSSAIAPTIPNVLLDPSSTPAGRIATKLAADLIGAAARELASGAARALSSRLLPETAPSPAKAARARASGAGYAGATSAAKTASAAKASTAKRTTTSRKTTSSRTSSSKHPAGYAFLDDPKLSIEDKLMMLLAKLNKQYEAEMQKHLDAMAPGKSPSSSSSSGSSGGGILGGFAKAVSGFVKNVPGAGAVADVLGNKTVQSILKTVSGPVLGAAASVLGFPEAAPVLMKLAPEIADVAGKVANEVSGSKSSDTGTSGTSSSGGGTTQGTAVSEGDKQLEYMQIQRLYDRQKEMFQLASNIFKSIHDTRSAIIGNLR